LLPQSSSTAGGEYRFAAQGIDEAKAIQANVVWWRGSFPNYLVGERPIESPKWREIMLLSAAPGELLKTAVVHTEQFAQAQEFADTVLTTPYSHAELDAVHDKPSGLLIIGRDTAGNMPEPRVRRTFSSTLNAVPAFTAIDGGLSPDMMELFDVEGHLNRLATTFGHVEQLDSLYAARDAAIQPFAE
jgi:hypothetical protein